MEIVERDDNCAAKEAEEAARALIAQGVALVVGHPCAAAAIAAAKVYAPAGIVFLAPATRNPALTEPRAGPTIFRLGGPRRPAGDRSRRLDRAQLRGQAGGDRA